MLMNDIFFSGTFGGETLSLAAAKATIGKMQQVKFDQYIWSLGEYLIEQYQEHCSEFSMFELKGLAPWTFLLINEGHDTPANTIKSWLIQELCKRGILFIGSHNLSLSHTKKDIDKLINAYRELFRQAEILNEQHSFAAHLDGLEIESIFKVR